jgi:hypothetical protein
MKDCEKNLGKNIPCKYSTLQGMGDICFFKKLFFNNF